MVDVLQYLVGGHVTHHNEGVQEDIQLTILHEEDDECDCWWDEYEIREEVEDEVLSRERMPLQPLRHIHVGVPHILVKHEIERDVAH